LTDGSTRDAVNSMRRQSIEIIVERLHPPMKKATACAVAGKVWQVLVD